ncbi:beta-ketoacyl-[acyl-carrier-protein] synthase family protein [Streptomyces iconiensis]|uniref:3-oxoacyl-[acyl-carrier-protein] synthase 2 n=1 Tax=Streptomyces iconiensis TaxID=1384038 RepID=A0ABT7A6A5_9ACTN|nr:beta-ketoacyl-ACP synthase II [Streptomyces iconiensis]MDJ1136554.1 beta-ketoacyl-ACP synthase II [Streptomyces iconiensis]
MQNANGPRVVVTGCGLISPLGSGVTDFWAAATAGRSGIDRISRFGTDALPVRFAGEIKEFDARAYMPNKFARRIDRHAQFAIAAAQQAVDQAGLKVDEELAPRTAVLVGSGYGAGQFTHQAVLDLRDHGVRGMTPYLASGGGLDSSSTEIATRFGTRGLSAGVATACATGSTCIGDGMRLIRHGYADVVIAGGADDAVNPVDVAAAANAGALSRQEGPASSRPFDKDRDGFVIASGAGVVVLESAGHARRRGAVPLAEIAGYGATTDAFHATQPHPEGLGAREAMAGALADAGITPADVDYICAHGTSTRLNDAVESRAIRTVFGDLAPRVPISSLKSMTGHMIGAAGAVEAIASIQAIRTGILPPTVNCDEPEDTGLDFVPHTARHRSTRTVLSNSFGFGGHNAVLVIRAADAATGTDAAGAGTGTEVRR